MDTHHQQHETKEGSSSILTSPVSTPSSDFSFTTIPLHSNSSNLVHEYSKTKTPSSSTSSSLAIDIPPAAAAADDIFFHGHLLPLHLLSHLPISPRSSTNSLENLNFPKKDSFDDPKRVKPTRKNHANESKVKNKSKYFALFSLKKRQTGEKEKGNKNKNMRFEFDVSHVLKRCMRMIRPLLLFRGKREKLDHIHRQQQAYSFSGNLNLRNKKTWFRRRKREYYSAPASTRTSPRNSGLLVATSDSTMEELQAAIQSAIAHCKNSIKGEDELKC